MVDEAVKGQSNTQGTVKGAAELVATYLALIGPILVPVLSRYFPYVTENFQSWAVQFIVTASSSIWLIFLYFAARRRIDRLGTFPRPEWLWRILTHRIGYKLEELDLAQAMVLVPPGKEEEASALRRLYNAQDKINLLFHVISCEEDGRIDEENGLVGTGEEVRSLEELALELRDCAAIVALDDCKWEKSYPKTRRLIYSWAEANTARPIMAIRINGRGTLRFSWRHLSDVLKNPQEMANSLLSQAVNRGAGWYTQAGLYRSLVFGGVIALLTAILLTTVFWQRSERFSRALEVDSHPRSELLRALGKFGSRASEVKGSSVSNLKADYELDLKNLLGQYASYMHHKISKVYPEIDHASLIVMLFSVSNTGAGVEIEEVAATRQPREIVFSAEPVDGVVEGIVSCAVQHRSVFLWEGPNKDTTRNITALGMDGVRYGEFDPDVGQIKLGTNKFCRYHVEDDDDQRKQMLCMPLGLDADNSYPKRAVCISSNMSSSYFSDKLMLDMVRDFEVSLLLLDFELAKKRI